MCLCFFCLAKVHKQTLSSLRFSLLCSQSSLLSILLLYFICLSPFSLFLPASLYFTRLQLLLLSNICSLWQPLKPRLISNSLTHQVYAMQYHLTVSASVSVGVLVASGSLPDNYQLTNLPTHQAPGKATQPIHIDFILLCCGLEFFLFHAHLANAGETFNLIIASFVGNMHCILTHTHSRTHTNTWW